MDDGTKAGLSAFGDLLDSGLFSDLEVLTGDGTKYNVHKAILCAQSSFFRNALSLQSGFLEARTNVIRLEKDEPAVVRALLEYCYRFNYEHNVEELNDAFHFHICVYALGETSCVQGLKDRAKERVEFFEWAHYDLEQLDFTLAVKTIYNTTKASDRGLRDLAVRMTRRSFDQAMELDGFQEMMGEVGQFSKDLCHSLQKDLKAFEDAPRYSCQGCRSYIRMELQPENDLSMFYCPYCKFLNLASEWELGKSKYPGKLPTWSQGENIVLSLRDFSHE
ncbi:hypothetical protein BC567DRAFT_263892 [Phyllosticta citribraziliensis]